MAAAKGARICHRAEATCGRCGGRTRLPVLLPESHNFMGDDIVRVQGLWPLFYVHRERHFTFVCVCEVDGAAVPVVIQPDREQWLQKRHCYY